MAAGGECLRSEIESALDVGEFLKAADRTPMSGGQERWKVMVRRARKPLRAEGWIADDAGVRWRITEAGRRAVERVVTGATPES